MLVFYERGNRRKHVAPDLFVVRGVERKQRAQYKVWEERVPEFVLEITSATTRHEDQHRKKSIYAALGVPEYYLFDPTGDYLDPPLPDLQALERRLPARHWQSEIISQALQLQLLVEGRQLIGFPGRRCAPVPGGRLPRLARGCGHGGARERARAEKERIKAHKSTPGLSGSRREPISLRTKAISGCSPCSKLDSARSRRT